MKKILLFTLICLFCFGCEAKYKLTINEDLSVTEEITGLETQDFFDNYYNSSKERVIGFMLETKEDYLDEIGYSDQLIIENELSGVLVSKQFDSLNEYFEKSEAYKQFYESMDYNFASGILTINLEDQLLKNENDQERFLIDDCEISITTPFIVEKSNADKIDRQTNTYIWNLNSEEGKNIYLKIDTTQKVNFELRKIFKYVLSSLIVISIILISYNIYKKHKKNNEIN